tara:strand:+ start:338 stop:529 length:192 start_codon:yes stop_codon:yes gene_type:complete
MNKIIISYIIASALALGLLHHAINKAQNNIETLAEVLVHHADTLEDHRGVLLQMIDDLTITPM